MSSKKPPRSKPRRKAKASSTPVDRSRLIDPKELLDKGDHPWTFLAFPRDLVAENGIPDDSDAQEYIGAIQSHGIPVGIWIDKPDDSLAYAFVGRQDIFALNKAIHALEESGRFREGHAERLSNRLVGIPGRR